MHLQGSNKIISDYFLHISKTKWIDNMMDNVKMESVASKQKWSKYELLLNYKL